jgi:major vault protein
MEDFDRVGRRMDTRDRDLIIAQGQYAYVLDKTKGIVGVCVGPFKTSLAGTDQPVIYDEEKRAFADCDLSVAIKQFPLARDGAYLVLENPAKDNKRPKQGSNGMEELDYGRKVNMRGPETFPLWPGQIAKVIPGHNLKSNEYLLVRVYNEDEAIKNWTEAVMKPQSGACSTDDNKTDKLDKENIEEKSSSESCEIKSPKPDLTTGKQFIIKGTDVSFYIPPTGIEVIPEANGNYVRNAVTLERLEYCILLDEDGNKRYVRGPAVVFPEPTEMFITEKESKKFRAIELNEISGIYIKVIADYSDENNKEHKVGEELFITGKDSMIYYPRPEQAIIKYGEQEKHFAVAIPVGEARYVLDRLTGEITLKKGPCMFLPDPRTEVIVRRVLDPKIVTIWFPGNKEALEYNQRLMNITSSKTAEEFVTEDDANREYREFFKRVANVSSSYSTGSPYTTGPSHANMPMKFAGDTMERKTTFTPPRTITLDTKYQGAVSIDVWTGYAILIISKGGNRRVVVGPQTVILEYDESLGIMELSTGKPKTDHQLIKTAYLRVINNKVSDIINIETKDLVKVDVRLSYLVNFKGEPEKWFDVENYVKLLTQHLRSVVRNAIKKKGIEEFYENSTDIIRDIILGSSVEGKRPGLTFKENGMHVYDVEVLDVKIVNESISKKLILAQVDVVNQTLELAQKRREFDSTKEVESLTQEINKLKTGTKIEEYKLLIDEIEERNKSNIKRIDSEILEKSKEIELNKERLKIEKDIKDQNLDILMREEALEITKLESETEHIVQIFKSIQPELIATMKTIGNQELTKKLAENLPKAAGSFGLLTKSGGMDALLSLVSGTPLEDGLKSLLGNKIEGKKEKD